MKTKELEEFVLLFSIKLLNCFPASLLEKITKSKDAVLWSYEKITKSKDVLTMTRGGKRSLEKQLRDRAYRDCVEMVCGKLQA